MLAKIEYQLNIGVFVWDYDNLIKNKINYNDQFKINKILNNKFGRIIYKRYIYLKKEKSLSFLKIKSFTVYIIMKHHIMFSASSRESN
jgi:hypothetical protein